MTPARRARQKTHTSHAARSPATPARHTPSVTSNSPSQFTESRNRQPDRLGVDPQTVTKDRARTQGYSALSLSPLLGPQRGDPSCTPYMTLVFREIQIQSENRPARGSAPGEIFDQNVRSVRSRFSGRVRGPFQIFLVRPENILVRGLVV